MDDAEPILAVEGVTFVIVADEPTAGLDPESTARLLDLLNRLHDDGRTVVISTHDVELALAWADNVLVLRRGELLGAGPPAAVFADAALVKEARLTTPIVLQAFERLRERGVLGAGARAPRTAAELVDLVVDGFAAAAGQPPARERPAGVRPPA